MGQCDVTEEPACLCCIQPLFGAAVELLWGTGKVFPSSGQNKSIFNESTWICTTKGMHNNLGMAQVRVDRVSPNPTSHSPSHSPACHPPSLFLKRLLLSPSETSIMVLFQSMEPLGIGLGCPSAPEAVKSVALHSSTCFKYRNVKCN